MTRTVTGAYVVALLSTAVAWAVAIPLGASNEVLGVLALVIGGVVVIAHTNHVIDDSERRRKSR